MKKLLLIIIITLLLLLLIIIIMASKTKTLVILESGSKIKKVQSYLGDKYLVKACFGHIRDLKSKSLSVEIENDYNPIYEISSDKKAIVKELKDAFKKCKDVILASDLDREGEAIAFHLSEILKIKPDKRQRLLFNEITKTSLQKAITELKPLNMNMVNAQQARRIVDRLIGYLITPMLWKHIQNSCEKKISLSAGRVQSVVLKLIIENEDEIKQHKPEHYFGLSGNFEHNIRAKYEEKLDSDTEVTDFLQDCPNIQFKIADNIKKASRSNPPKPFITSTLQQEASNKFHMSPKQTMATAQKLYEKGLITYMRTDSFNFSQEFLENCGQYIKDTYGEPYHQLNKYETKSETSQEAHEAIRPTDVNLNEASSVCDDAYEQKLYKLIWKRSVASQMTQSKFDNYTLKIEMDLYENYFISKFNKTTFDGFKKVYEFFKEPNEDEAEENNSFPVNIKVGTVLKFNEIYAQENVSTSKKSHYTEAGLIKQLDKLEIGRPSTYSSMVSVVQDRKYVEKKNIDGKETKLSKYSISGDINSDGTINRSHSTKKIGGELNKLVPNAIGYIVNDFMKKHFAEIIDYTFTKNLEQELDKVSNGLIPWNGVVDTIYNSFKTCIDTLKEKSKDINKKLLGNHPKTGLPIYTYVSKYGPVIYYNENYIPIKDIQIDAMTLQEAIAMVKFPLKLSDDITVKKGKYGFYFKYNDKNYSMGNEIDSDAITVEKCHEIIKEKTASDGNITSNIIKKYADLTIMNGKYGAYINYKNKNYKIYGRVDAKDLTKAQCLDIIKKKK